MKVYAGVVTIALLVAALYIVHQQNRPTQENATAQQPVASASLLQQKACADQAKKDFIDGGWRLDGGTVNGFMASYTDHFAPLLNKCFLQLFTLGGTPNSSSSYVIFDAFEMKEYAHYTTMYFSDSRNTKIMDCDATLPGEGRLTCKEKNDWDRMVRPLMGQ